MFLLTLLLFRTCSVQENMFLIFHRLLYETFISEQKAEHIFSLIGEKSLLYHHAWCLLSSPFVSLYRMQHVFSFLSIVTLTLSCPDDGKFPEAVRVLLTWLERGEVNRRNANNFYSMIQSSNSHIRRLMSEKSQHEKEMEEAKDKFKTALAGILAQCELLQSLSQTHTCIFQFLHCIYCKEASYWTIQEEDMMA